nr:MAG TPA: membrane protein [Caudoviricetes sp.]
MRRAPKIFAFSFILTPLFFTFLSFFSVFLPFRSHSCLFIS